MIMFKTKFDLEECITCVRLRPRAIIWAYRPGLPCLFPFCGTLHEPDLGLASDLAGLLLKQQRSIPPSSWGTSASVPHYPSAWKLFWNPAVVSTMKTRPGIPLESGHCTHETTRWAGSPTEWYERNAPTPGELSRRGFGEFQELNLGILGRSSCAAPDNTISWHYQWNTFIRKRN